MNISDKVIRTRVEYRIELLSGSSHKSNECTNSSWIKTVHAAAGQ